MGLQARARVAPAGSIQAVNRRSRTRNASTGNRVNMEKTDVDDCL